MRFEDPNENTLKTQYVLLKTQLERKGLAPEEQARLQAQLASVKAQLPPEEVKHIDTERTSRKL